MYIRYVSLHHMKRIIYLILIGCIAATHATYAQQIVVADAITYEGLPFATVKQENGKGIITDMHGRFTVPPQTRTLSVSYIGHMSRTITYPFPDTVFLDLQTGAMTEVVVKPPYDKIKYIIDHAIRNKPEHNPDKYEQYNCAVYYKMNIDIVPNEKDTATAKENGLRSFLDKSHVIFAETYSRRYHKKSGLRQEIIEASRFSGLQKTYFTNLVTDILPFHVYNDFITLNSKDYIHPVSAGWQQRYSFDLLDEVPDGKDTTYILKYRPAKNATFNSLYGTVYIHSGDFAISHIIANTTNPVDSSTNRYVQLEQVYRQVDGKWFPQELNYQMTFKEYPNEKMGMVWRGHSIVDSVSFTPFSNKIFDKAHPVKLSDSVDLHSAAEWGNFRPDTLSEKEKNTYVIVDSLSEKTGVEKVINAFRNINRGMLSLGYTDIALRRILAFNQFEGTRVGLGLYSNDKISRYFSAGGWLGYGFKDKVWKYGASVRIFPRGGKENWIELAYQDNYRSTGSVNFHDELTDNSLRQWILAQVDHVQEYGATLHWQAGYYEFEISPSLQKLEPLYAYNFTEPGTNDRIFDRREISAGLRYAYREMRTLAFGYYIPTHTKYPVLYLRLSGGEISSGSYKTQYLRTLAAVTYDVHINRWGRDYYRAEGGIIHTIDDKALPRSYLLAGNGYRMSRNYQLYSDAGLLTLYPYQYFSDKYITFLFRHDFDKALFKIGDFMKPTPGFAHNMLYGSLNAINTTANPGTIAPSGGYHESGIILNKLLIYDLAHLAYLDINIGAFYHWAPAPFDWKKYGRITLAASMEL